MERKEPWVINEETKTLTLNFPGKEELKDWVKQFDENAMWVRLKYTLGSLFIAYGSFLKKNEGKIEKVDILGIEITMITFISWITKVVLGDKIIININRDNLGGVERFNLGNFYKYINCNKLVEDINLFSVRELRELTEIFATANFIIADALYQIDFGSILGDTPHAETTEVVEGREKVVNKVTSWQAYGRYSLRKIRKEIIDSFKKEHDICLLIPCTMGKPYYGNLKNINPNLDDLSNSVKREIAEANKDVVVMTTIGVVPQDYWLDPVDLGYDIRVPDLWADFLSLKEFFKKNRYEKVISYINYGPYIEMMQLLTKVGIIKEVEYKKPPDLAFKKGNLGAFFSIKQGDKDEFNG